MKRGIIVLFVILFLGACQENVMDKSFERTNGTENKLAELSGKSGMVLVFMSPECPLCQNYTRTINLDYLEQQPNGINVIGVVSGKYVSKEEVTIFEESYDTEFPIILDPDFTLSKAMNATTTPEVIFLDSLNNIKYRGAIDNWAISLGQKRLKITQHYLDDALKSYLSGNEITVQTTKPVGCYIE